MTSWYFQWAISIKATCNGSPSKLSWIILKTQWFFIIWNTWKGFLSKPLELLVWWYSVVLSQRHWHVIADLQTEPSCFVSHETKELLTVTKIYITVINVVIFTISIAIIIIIIIIIINIIINGNTISIINMSFTCTWRICWIRHIFPAILVSHDFWRQIFSKYFFLFTFSLFKSYKIIVTWAIEQILPFSETKRLKSKSFHWNETIKKYIQVSIFIGKRQWWRLFSYSCKYKGLQLHEKVTHNRCFCLNFAKFYRTLFLNKTTRWLLLISSNILHVSLIVSEIN